MRTRTLLLLAIACGLAILLAGGIQLIRVSGDRSGTPDLSIGQSAQAGDVAVTVLSAAETGGAMRVEVRLGGVDDPLGLDGFRLVVPGAALRPDVSGPSSDGRCIAITEAEQTCSLVFVTTAVEGSARVLLLRRGEDQQRWSLA